MPVDADVRVPRVICSDGHRPRGADYCFPRDSALGQRGRSSSEALSLYAWGRERTISARFRLAVSPASSWRTSTTASWRASWTNHTPSRRLIASGPPASLVVDQDPARTGGPDA